MVTGMVLDCGSGHTSVLWYGMSGRNAGKIAQLRRSKLKLPQGGNFKITDCFKLFEGHCMIAESTATFADALVAEINDAASSGIPSPGIVFVGATGGLRNMLDDGRLKQTQVSEFKSLLLARLAQSGEHEAKFAVITGEQESTWELAAANLIYGHLRQSMFPRAPPRERDRFGLFSGGGSSMQAQEARGAPLSFPFSTWCGPEMDEALGAAADAWKDADKWGRWEAELLARIELAKASLVHGQLGGCFVLTAMNHVAATASGFAERPICADEAIDRLGTALEQFRRGSGEPFESFVAGALSVHPTVHAWYSSQPAEHLARVGAMHMRRLQLVLQHLFAPQSMLFAPPGTLGSSARLDCEWTLELFAREAEALLRSRHVASRSGGPYRVLRQLVDFVHQQQPSFGSSRRVAAEKRTKPAAVGSSPVMV